MKKLAIKILIVSLMMSISGKARSDKARSESFGLTTEIEDLTKDTKVVRLYKDQKAPFDGALVPFNTLRSFSEIRYNYEHLKDEYIKYGIMDDDRSARRDFSTYGIIAFASALIATAIVNDENRGTMVLISSLGMAGSIAVLVF